MASPTSAGTSRTVNEPSASTSTAASLRSPFASLRTAETFTGSAGAGPSSSSRPRMPRGSPTTGCPGAVLSAPVKRESCWTAGGWMTCSQYSVPYVLVVTAKRREPSADQPRPRGATLLPSSAPSKANSSGAVRSAGSAACTSRSAVPPVAEAPRARYLPSPLKATAEAVAPSGNGWYCTGASDKSAASSSRVPAAASATAIRVPSKDCATSFRSSAPLPSLPANRRSGPRTSVLPVASKVVRKGSATPRGARLAHDEAAGGFGAAPQAKPPGVVPAGVADSRALGRVQPAVPRVAVAHGRDLGVPLLPAGEGHVSRAFHDVGGVRLTGAGLRLRVEGEDAVRLRHVEPGGVRTERHPRGRGVGGERTGVLTLEVVDEDPSRVAGAVVVGDVDALVDGVDDEGRVGGDRKLGHLSPRRRHRHRSGDGGQARGAESQHGQGRHHS